MITGRAASERRPAAPESEPRALVLAGQAVAPGESRLVRLPLPGRTHTDDAMPVWLAVGLRPGPRVIIAAAPRGFEVTAARAASRLTGVIDAASLRGAVAVVPVFRPGGRFVARGLPVDEASGWRFPGDAGGNARARDAFVVFSQLVAGASVLVLVTAAEPGRRAALVARGDLHDPRVRRLADGAGVRAAVQARPAAGTLLAVAAEAGVTALELVTGCDEPGRGRGPGAGQNDDEQALLGSLQSLLVAAGALTSAAVEPAGSPPPLVSKLTVVRAATGGLVEDAIAVGQAVGQGALLARITAPLGTGGQAVRAPHDALVLEVQTRTGVRARAPLFVLGRVPAAVIARDRRRGRASANAAPAGAADLAAAARVAGVPAPPLRVGWVERISLPALGVTRLPAKIDTGARTSALHVTRMKTVGTGGGPQRRPILEVTLPRGRGQGAEALSVRVPVRDFVQIKDTSGRTERRPVIETTLRLGTLERRIRVTLTNRDDMLFPMLIGRTALGPGVVVDPAGRLLLDRSRAARVAEAPAPRPRKRKPES